MTQNNKTAANTSELIRYLKSKRATEVIVVGGGQIDHDEKLRRLVKRLIGESGVVTVIVLKEF